MSEPSQSSLIEVCKCELYDKECTCGLNDTNSEFPIGYYGGNTEKYSNDGSNNSNDTDEKYSNDGSDSADDTDSSENEIDGGFDGDFTGGSYDSMIGGELHNLYISPSEFSENNESSSSEYNPHKSTGIKHIESIGGDRYDYDEYNNGGGSDTESVMDNDNKPNNVNIDKSDNSDTESVMDSGEGDSSEGDSKTINSDNESIMYIDDKNKSTTDNNKTRKNNVAISGGSDDIAYALNDFLKQTTGLN